MTEQLHRWRPRRLFVRLFGALIAALVLLEVSFRVVLFGGLEFLEGPTRALRQPAKFADRLNGDEYWRLKYALADPANLRPVPNPDGLVGWLRDDVDAETYEHAAAKGLSGRRPLILYGDSFSECVEDIVCWEDLLSADPLGERFHMLNYGKGGYGVDQMAVLLEQSIDHYVELDPVVAIGILVDNDMDRCVLSFRSWPKARFRKDGPGLALEGPLPKSPNGASEWIDEHGTGIKSYAWRYLFHGSNLLPDSWRDAWLDGAEALEYKWEINRRLVARLVRTLESREIEYFFVLFAGPGSITNKRKKDWRENFLVRVLSSESAPFVRVRPLLEKVAKDRGHSGDPFFVEKGPGRNHYNESGNEVAFEAFRMGIAQRFDQPYPTGTLAQLVQLEGKILRGEGAFARFVTVPRSQFSEPDDSPRLMLRVGSEGATEIKFLLSSGVRRFTAFVKPFPESEPEATPAELEIFADAERVLSCRVDANTEAIPVDVPLDGIGHLRFVLSSGAVYLAPILVE